MHVVGGEVIQLRALEIHHADDARFVNHGDGKFRSRLRVDHAITRIEGDVGAIDDDLKLMRRCSPPQVQVKAAGGVRTFERVLALRAIGVARVGATATKAIL